MASALRAVSLALGQRERSVETAGDTSYGWSVARPFGGLSKMGDGSGDRTAGPSRGALGCRNKSQLFIVVGALLVSLFATGCSQAGSMSCPEFMRLTSAEQSDAFAEAVRNRGLEHRGPEWQAGLQVATVESHCTQRPGATLEEGLDFLGVPDRAQSRSPDAGMVTLLVALSAAGITAAWARMRTGQIGRLSMPHHEITVPVGHDPVLVVENLKHSTSIRPTQGWEYEDADFDRPLDEATLLLKRQPTASDFGYFAFVVADRALPGQIRVGIRSKASPAYFPDHAAVPASLQDAVERSDRELAETPPSGDIRSTHAADGDDVTAVVAWLGENGPAERLEIITGLGLPEDAVGAALRHLQQSGHVLGSCPGTHEARGQVFELSLIGRDRLGQPPSLAGGDNQDRALGEALLSTLQLIEDRNGDLRQESTDAGMDIGDLIQELVARGLLKIEAGNCAVLTAEAGRLLGASPLPSGLPEEGINTFPDTVPSVGTSDPADHDTSRATYHTTNPNPFRKPLVHPITGPLGAYPAPGDGAGHNAEWKPPAWQRILGTVDIGNNVLITVLLTIFSLGALWRAVSGGPLWLLLVAAGVGWLAWSCIREDRDEILRIWSLRGRDSA